MSINAQDVRTLSSDPGPGGVPLPATEVDRIADDLNRSSTDQPAREPTGSALTGQPTPSAPVTRAE